MVHQSLEVGFVQDHVAAVRPAGISVLVVEKEQGTFPLPALRGDLLEGRSGEWVAAREGELGLAPVLAHLPDIPLGAAARARARLGPAPEQVRVTPLLLLGEALGAVVGRRGPLADHRGLQEGDHLLALPEGSDPVRGAVVGENDQVDVP